MASVETAADGYPDRAELLNLMGRKVEGLVADVLAARGITVHSITHRVKTRRSTEAKLAKDPGKYSTLADLHDLLGARIITHLASDVDEVVATLRSEFEVDEARSFDKQSELDPDRFGYRSFHLVMKLNSTREALLEWRSYKGVYFEIQIRSILQHSWAEIEHDLGYKTSATVPAVVRRRFARLAGLLELADAEFDAISDQIEAHQREVKAVVAEGKSVAIDRDSVVELIATNGPVKSADISIANNTGARLEQSLDSRYADARARELIRFGYTTTAEVEEDLASLSERLIAFASAWLAIPEKDASAIPDSPDRDESGRYIRLSPGISLFYLYLHRALDTDDPLEHLASVHGLHEPEVLGELQRIHRKYFAS